MEAMVSHVPVQNKVARWRIEGADKLSQQPGDYVDSEIFIKVEEPNCFTVSFMSRLFWGGAKEESAQYISVVAIPQKYSSTKLMWRPTQIVLVNQSGGEDKVWRDGDKQGNTISNGIGPSRFHLRDTLTTSGFMVEGTIILELHVSVWMPELKSFCTPKVQDSPVDTLRAFAADFAALRGCGQGSDVSLKAGNPYKDGTEPQSLRAHRLVLAARSPVFQRMFYGPTEMAESEASAEVCLSDMEPQVVEFFVHFLYTGQVNDEVWKDDDAVCHLLSAGHKYEVSSLVDRCVAHVICSLNEQNAAERLALADLLGIAKIRQAALDYMCTSSSRLARIQSTQAFTRLGQTRPHLLLEIMSKMHPPATPSCKRKADAGDSLPENLAAKTVAQLKQLCNDRGIEATGNKQTLIERLRNHVVID